MDRRTVRHTLARPSLAVSTAVSISGYDAVAVSWEPGSQTVVDGLTAHFILKIANQGNMSALYQISAAAAGADVSLPRSTLLLPPGRSAQLPVAVRAPQAGEYTLTGAVDVPGGASAGDSAEVTFVGQPQGALGALFLPVLFKQEAQPGGQGAAAGQVFLPLTIGPEGVTQRVDGMPVEAAVAQDSEQVPTEQPLDEPAPDLNAVNETGNEDHTVPSVEQNPVE